MNVPVSLLVQVLIPLLALAAMYGSLSSKIAQVSKSQDEFKGVQTKQGEAIHKIEVDLATMRGQDDARESKTGAHRPLQTIQVKS